MRARSGDASGNPLCACALEKRPVAPKRKRMLVKNRERMIFRAETPNMPKWYQAKCSHLLATTRATDCSGILPALVGHKAHGRQNPAPPFTSSPAIVFPCLRPEETLPSIHTAPLAPARSPAFLSRRSVIAQSPCSSTLSWLRRSGYRQRWACNTSSSKSFRSTKRSITPPTATPPPMSNSI